MFRTLLSILAPNFLDKLGLLHGLKTDGPIMYLLNVIGSFPYITLARLLISVNAMGEGKTSMSYIILLKLLKSFEIKRYINQIEEKMFYKTAKSIIILRFVLNFGLVLFISHCAASAWLLVQELSSVGWSDNKYTFNNPLNPFSSSNWVDFQIFKCLDVPYFARNGLEDASNLRKYVDSLLWAVTTMSGCTFGDVTPRTTNEVLVCLIIFVVGASVLAKVFGDFASLNYLLSIESTQEKWV